ncbi:hypothetical protein CDD82_3425 [Ophiocordyceps australis]|uniref:Extracellular membrane protein CFEM domain-containing protein n=1 Tax=Ophiocordyceps australis TaxID=1399860 RepID=A0A2C5ZTE7_9HYPO|nr:hypothetical protein CDD82_3425 [Ophiocordyceps australis]
MKNTAVVAAVAGLALPASAHIMARQDAVDPDLAACLPQGDSSAACFVVEGIETECNAKDGAEHQSCMCTEKPFFPQWSKCRECIFRNRPQELSSWINNLGAASSSLCNAANPTLKFQEIFAALPEPTAVDAQTTAASTGPTATASAASGTASGSASGSANSSDNAESPAGARPNGDDTRQGAARITSAPVAQATSFATSAATSAAATASTTASSASSASTTATRNGSIGMTIGTSARGGISSGAALNTAAASILAIAAAGAALMVL